jgi:hypothetical protein
MADLVMTVRTPTLGPGQTDRGDALVSWLAERLGEGFKVEIPSPASPCSDGFRRYYVRKGGRRAVVRVMADFLRARDDDDFTPALLSGSPTILDLIRAGALHIDIDERGAASALHPPCR